MSFFTQDPSIKIFLANEICLWILFIQNVTRSSSRACTISQSHKICSMVSVSHLQNERILVSLSFILCKKEFLIMICTCTSVLLSFLTFHIFTFFCRITCTMHISNKPGTKHPLEKLNQGCICANEGSHPFQKGDNSPPL